MSENKLQNGKASVEQKMVQSCMNKVVVEATNKIFKKIMDQDTLSDIVESFHKKIVADLRDGNFMTQNLELSQEQRDRMLGNLKGFADSSKSEYSASINKDERTKETAQVIQLCCKEILEELLSSIAQEVNRGAIINCVAVAGDTKNGQYNKIELNHSKTSGDITLPSRCLLISTNAMKTIEESVKVIEEEEAE